MASPRSIVMLLMLFMLVFAAAAPGAGAQGMDSTHHDTAAARRFVEKGDAAMAAHAPDSARAAYEKAIQYDADDIDAILKMATILIDEGHGGYARDLLTFALKRHPTDPRLLHYHYVRRGADTTGAATVGP
ncbi:MAG TPA: tetratricopeptide repeat protein [Gemmatimonadaceae bacterium]|jgi:Tfp pilus assembly protein PilF|nr:tetratricopeptide repeat protein [Gemmatimonadaceae bacterium]